MLIWHYFTTLSSLNLALQILGLLKFIEPFVSTCLVWIWKSSQLEWYHHSMKNNNFGHKLCNIQYYTGFKTNYWQLYLCQFVNPDNVKFMAILYFYKYLWRILLCNSFYKHILIISVFLLFYIVIQFYLLWHSILFSSLY